MDNESLEPTQAQAPVEAPQEKPSLEGLLSTLISEVRSLKEDNRALRESQIALQETVAQAAVATPAGYAGDPASLSKADVARSVTITTRPVLDNPAQYTNVTEGSSVRWAN